jgi:hypothetical protein
MSRQLTYRALSVVLGVFMLAAGLAYAGGGEVAVYGGLNRFTGEGGESRPIVGGTVGGFAGERALIFGDFSYVPLHSESGSGSVSGVGYRYGASAKAINAGGGVHIGNNKGGERKVAPYAVVAGGFLHSWVSGSGSALGTSVTVRESLANGGYYGGGVGVRLFAGKAWGIRPEFQYRRYQFSAGNDNVILLTVGLFKSFGK